VAGVCREAESDGCGLYADIIDAVIEPGHGYTARHRTLVLNQGYGRGPQYFQPSGTIRRAVVQMRGHFNAPLKYPGKLDPRPGWLLRRLCL
jgi:hypothetical protein